MEGINLLRKEIECGNIFLMIEENNGRNNQGQQARLHCTEDCLKGTVLQHPQGYDICLLNCTTHFYVAKALH